MVEEHEDVVLQVNAPGSAPRALVFVGKASRPLTPAEAKRSRFVKNLKDNYARLKESMAAFERFALICGLSQERVEAIRKANQDALDELSRKFDERLAEYDRRIAGEARPPGDG